MNGKECRKAELSGDFFSASARLYIFDIGYNLEVQSFGLIGLSPSLFREGVTVEM